ncbi:MAG: hypothetical protein LJE68_12475 [Rhodobacter sp.]|nr:hypothetical protein [Rhodobacter sp.]
MTACAQASDDMAVADNTYSRVIAWLKILLPLAALAILSTLFLVARAIVPAQDLPFADVDVDELATQQRIGQPNYSSVTRDGAAISLSAESARPDSENPEKLSGEEIRAGIDLPNGNRINIVAQRMQIDNTLGIARLSDGVVVETSDGYTLRTDTVEISLDATRVEATEPTRVDTPIGQLSADSFRLAAENEGERPYVLVFKGHVKLVYDPNE